MCPHPFLSFVFLPRHRFQRTRERALTRSVRTKKKKKKENNAELFFHRKDGLDFVTVANCAVHQHRESERENEEDVKEKKTI